MTETFKYHTIVRQTSAREAVRATVTLHSLGGQAPYFSITGDVFEPGYRRHETNIHIDGKSWTSFMGGCVHDEVRKAFPELDPFIRWHLTSVEAPMHCVANGLFHHNLWTAFIAGPPWDGSLRDEHERRSGCTIECGKWVHYPREGDTLEQSRKNFYSTIIHGAVPTDAEMSEDAIIGMDKAELTAWLEGRLPALKAAFEADMVKVRALRAVIGEKS